MKKCKLCLLNAHIDRTIHYIAHINMAHPADLQSSGINDFLQRVRQNYPDATLPEIVDDAKIKEDQKKENEALQKRARELQQKAIKEADELYKKTQDDAKLKKVRDNSKNSPSIPEELLAIYNQYKAEHKAFARHFPLVLQHMIYTGRYNVKAFRRFIIYLEEMVPLQDEKQKAREELLAHAKYERFLYHYSVRNPNPRKEEEVEKIARAALAYDLEEVDRHHGTLSAYSGENSAEMSQEQRKKIAENHAQFMLWKDAVEKDEAEATNGRT